MNTPIEIYNKKTFKNCLPEILKSHTKQYDLFFLTITFQNVVENLPKAVFENYFGRVFQKINQSILNQPSKHPDKKVKMILLPEASYASATNMSKSPHYHGILMVRKELTEKFIKKCLSEFRSKINSYDKLVKYSNFQLPFQNNLNKYMKSYSNEIQRVYDVDGLCDYITKSALTLSENKTEFSFKEAREFQKLIPTSRDNRLLTNDYITSDEYLIFI